MSTYTRIMEFAELSEGRRFGPTNMAINTVHKKSAALRAATKSLNLVHLGNIFYGPEGGPATHKKNDAGDNVVPLTPDEKVSIATKKKDTDTDAGARVGPEKRIDPHHVTFPKPDKKDPLANYNAKNFEEDIHYYREITLKRFDDSPGLNDKRSILEPAAIRMFKQLKSISKLRPTPASTDELRTKLQAFIDEWRITQTQNSALRAWQLTNTSGLYKFFGENPTKASRYLMKLIDIVGLSLNLVATPDSQAKNELSACSKPKFGSAIHAANAGDPVVREIFGGSTFAGVAQSYHAVFGPTSLDGTLLRSGGANAKASFQYSVANNNSVELTIAAAERLANIPDQTPTNKDKYQRVADVFTEHRHLMRTTAQKFDTLDPIARSDSVGKIYARLAQGLHFIDAGIAKAIMKNVGECALFDIELAGDLEVYMPAEGTFPIGDKILVTRTGTKIEKIESIDIKFGSSGAVHGMAAPAGNICKYHPDSWYYDAIDDRFGRAGKEVGVKGEIIHQPDKFQRMAKESKFDTCLSDESLEHLRVIGVEATQYIQKYTKNHANTSVLGQLAPKYMENLKIDKSMLSFCARIQEQLATAPDGALQELLGQKNYTYIMNSEQPDRALGIYSIMTFGAALNSSNGFSTILHNYQEITKDGKYNMKTLVGSPKLADWQAGVLGYGEHAKGLTMGYNPTANTLTNGAA